MKTNLVRWFALTGFSALGAALLIHAAAPHAGFKVDDSDVKNVITGTAAFDDYRSEKPGTFRKITVADLPKPFATESSRNNPHVVPRPADAWPQAPAGFKVELYANEDLQVPREIRTAPNGDLFLADSQRGHD